MLSGKVRTCHTAAAGPGVAFLEVDLVVTAVFHPNLEHALDVHLDHVLLLEPVFGLEEFFEDGIVEGLGTEQTDVQRELLGYLAGLA